MMTTSYEDLSGTSRHTRGHDRLPILLAINPAAEYRCGLRRGRVGTLRDIDDWLREDTMVCDNRTTTDAFELPIIYKLRYITYE
jgi:hypothetical protein